MSFSARSARAHRALYRVFLAAAILSVFAALVNVKVVPMLGRPLTYQWLYYSDFLGSKDARNAIFAELSPKSLFAAIAAIAGLFVLARLFSIGLTGLLRRFGPPRVELKRGYKTAFFNAADNRYRHADRFLSHRAFDRLVDYRNVPCDAPVLVASRTEWPFLDGKDDMCVADASVAWIDSVGDRPFFAVLWTMMTHFPYFAAEPLTDFGVPIGFNNYLNALRRADTALARLLQALKRRGLDRSKLVVVVGDHGEAFGEHDQWSHARFLREPRHRLRIPRMLVKKLHSTV